MDKFKSFLASKWHIIVMVVLVIFISWPVLFMTMPKGHDLEFHLMRIEGLRQDVSFSNFPVRMQSNWMDGYGYPVSILYGDLFLYLPALFRMLGFAIMPAYRMFLFCLNAATVISAYWSYIAIFKKKETALFSTVLYTTSAYVLVDEYARAVLGETISIVFLPIVLASIYVFFTEEDKKKRYIAAAFIAIAITGIACAHTLIISMLLVVMAPSVIIGLFLFVKKSERLRRFGDLVLAALITVLLSAFFVVPFLDFFLNADIGFQYEGGKNIQGEGLTLIDMLNFFTNPYRTGYHDIQKTPGIAMMTALVGAIVFIVVSLVRKKNTEHLKRYIFEVCLSIFILLLSSRIFPWNYIEKNMPLGKLFTSIEFPMRYLVFAVTVLAMLAGDMLEVLKEKKIRNIVVTIAAIMCIFNVVNICVYTPKYEKKALFMETEDLGRWDYYAMDFQLRNTSVYEVDTGIKQEGLLSMEVVSRDSNDWMIACVSGPDYGWIQLPMFNYPYYYAVDVEDPSKVFEIHEGANRTVGVLLPAEYSGILHVYWKEPMLWRVMELISAVTFLGILTLLFYDRIRKRIMK